VIGVAFLQASLSVGGAERVVEAVARGLDRSRIQPHIFNLYGPGPIGRELSEAGLHTVSHLASSRFDTRVACRLGRVLDEHGVKAIYITDSALPMFWAGIIRRTRSWPRMVLGFHTTTPLRPSVRAAVSRAMSVPVADRLVALSNDHRRFLAHTLRTQESRIDVVRSGVNLGLFNPGMPRAEARLLAGLPAQVPLAGIIAALRPEKNHSLFLRAARRVLRQIPEARFVIAGDGPERPRIERQCAELGISDRVLLLGTRTDVALICRGLDVAVLSSSAVETVPLALLEASGCATPSVATAVGSVEEIVVDGETGFTVAPGDEAALAERIGRLLASGALRERLGAAARRRAEERFDEREMIRSYQDLFLSVAEARG